MFGSLSSAKAITFIDTLAAVTFIKLTLALNTLLAMMNLALKGCSALSNCVRERLSLVQQGEITGVVPLALTTLTAAHSVSLLTYSALYNQPWVVEQNDSMLYISSKMYSVAAEKPYIWISKDKGTLKKKTNKQNQPPTQNAASSMI